MPDEPLPFIVIEGLDGSGKTTQLDLLRDRLAREGREVYLTAEPTELPTGKFIRRALRREISLDAHTLAALFAADRLEHLLRPEVGILARLAAGQVVVSSRYYFSSLAYQSEEVDPAIILDFNRPAMHLRPAALTIFLDLPPEVSMRRIARRGDHAELYESERKLAHVRQSFLDAFARYGKEENIVTVDASRSIDTVADDIWHAVKLLI